MVARPVRPAAKPAPKDDPDTRADEREDGEEAPAATARPARRAAPAAAPTRTKPRVRDDADERDDEEDDAPPLRGGWGEFKSNRAKSSKIPDRFTVEKSTSYVIAFLDDAPFVSWNQHWIERAGKKSFVCLESDCPLCDILGAEIRAMAAFNIAVFEEVKIKGEAFIEPVVKVWELGSGIGSQLESLATDKATGPLTKGYWLISKAGKPVRYSILPIKERDLEEDHGFQPLTEEEIQELSPKKFDATYIRRNSRSELKDVADEES